MTRHTSFVIVIFLLLAACNSKSGQLANPPSQAANSENGFTEEATTPSQAVKMTEGQVEPLTIQGSKTEVAGNPEDLNPNTTPVVDTIKFNPPHGEPGHRCDVAVGAIMSPPTGVSLCK